MLLSISETLNNWDIFWPVIWLLAGAAVCVSIELSARNHEWAKMPVFFTAVASVVLATVSLFNYWAMPELANGGTVSMLMDGLQIDRFGLYLCAAILLGTGICCFTSLGAIDKLAISLADHLALVLVAATGMLLLVTSNDLIMVFLAVELMSLAIYVLVGMNRHSGRSAEAAMKYFVMGAFASGFLLLGMALIYGVTGEIQLPAIGQALHHVQDGYAQLVLLGVGLMLIGFGFKVGAVPFHQWVPDAYTGAPTPVTGFMAVAVKIAAFGIFVRAAFTLLPAGTEIGRLGTNVLWVLAAATMLLGNWFAVTQESVKRMLAYSSVAHSGYLLMGIVAAQSIGGRGIAPVLFYLVVYAFGTGGAFALLSYATGEGEGDDRRAFRGLAFRKPAVAVGMTIFLLSLAGVPLTGGFLGKYYLFSAAMEAQQYWLALIGIIASLIGAYYYLYVVVLMYMKDSTEQVEHADAHWGAKLTFAGAALATLFLGILPSLAIDPADAAVSGLRRNSSPPTAVMDASMIPDAVISAPSAAPTPMVDAAPVVPANAGIR